MKSKFKVGDRVRVYRKCGEGCRYCPPVGYVGVITVVGQVVCSVDGYGGIIYEHLIHVADDDNKPLPLPG